MGLINKEWMDEYDRGLKARLTEMEGDIESNASDIASLKASFNCVGFRIKLSDTVKVMETIGSEAQVAAFKNWVDTSAKPCEVKKDGTDFAYLRNEAGVASSVNWLKRVDGNDSHYDSADKADYLQMVEKQNVNLSFSYDRTLDNMEVKFNFDENCPAGYHRWFKEPTKLFARYDGSKNVADNTKYDIMKGGKWTGDNSVQVIHSMNKATNTNILEKTGWEIAVESWIMAFYYGTFDLQTALGSGISSGSQSAAETFTNGITDSLATPHGKVATTGGEAIRFMYEENPYGLRWIWGAGVRGELTKGYFTYDEDKANSAALMSTDDADEEFTILATSNTYAKNVNVLGIPTDTGGSASSGFYDGNWSNITTTQRILYVGGASSDGVVDGPFARYVRDVVSISGWVRRGRGALKKSVVVSA